MTQSIVKRNLAAQLEEIRASIDRIQPIQAAADKILGMQEHIEELDESKKNHAQRISTLENENKEIHGGLSDIGNKVTILIIVILISFSDDVFKTVSPVNQYLSYSDVVAVLAIMLGVTALVSKQMGGVIGTLKSKIGK